MTSVTFPPSLGGDGTTVSDDSNPATGLGNGGHRTRFIPAMGQVLACMNGALAQAQGKVDAATAQAALAEESADDSAASALEAAGYAASALSAPGTNATSTSSLTIGTGGKSLTLAQAGKNFVVGQFVELVNATANWMLGNITAFNSGTGAMTVDVTHIGGSGTFAAWTVTPAVPSQIPSPAGNAGKALLANPAGNGYVFGAVDDIARVPRSSNTQLVKADKGSWFNATANFTQTFDTANLGANWNCWYSTDPGAEVTIPASDGVTNWIMYGGETRFFQWDGTTLRSYVVTPFAKTFTSSANFIRPPGYQYFGGLIWNGGNGGRKDTTGGAGVNGSAGGGCFPFMIPAASLAATTAVTVGAGGVGSSVLGDGTLGGASSIGTALVMSQSSTIFLGSGIAQVNTASPAAHSAGFEGGQVNTAGATIAKIVWGGGAGSHNANANASSCIYGGAGSGAVDGSGTLRAPGTSLHGGNGGTAGDAVSGGNGTAPGGAGGPTRTGAKAGDGARGEVRIWGVV